MQDGVYDRFVDAMKVRAQKTAIGMPHEEDTSFGPLVSAGSYQVMYPHEL